jgi:hypothetical protein
LEAEICSSLDACSLPLAFGMNHRQLSEPLRCMVQSFHGNWIPDAL